VPTVAMFADERFMPFVRTEKAGKPLTVAFYQRCTGNLKAHKALASLPLDQIRTEHITAFVESRRSEPVKTATINRDLATLRRMLNLAEEWELIPAARSIKLLPGEAQRERVISTSEETAYLAACKPLLRNLTVIMLDCGLRPEECHRLRWADNIKGDAIEVHTGKGAGSRRRIEMTERVADVLADRKSDGFVFPASTKAGHIDTHSYKKQHSSALADSKVGPFVIYSLRHTCLTRWALAGMDLFTLKYLAGHQNIATTMRYIHLAQVDAQEKLREIRQRMAEVRGGHSFGHSSNQQLKQPIADSALNSCK
jgi:integrase